ncbi:MAG: hypothetical protein M3203_13625, partial [Actinomycetota bacterium]|nr:hypothetical protein [Actinomycetota bacterium]
MRRRWVVALLFAAAFVWMWASATAGTAGQTGATTTVPLYPPTPTTVAVEPFARTTATTTTTTSAVFTTTTSTPAGATTTTTVPPGPTTTATTVPPTSLPPPPRPSLDAGNPDGGRSGPPGVGLDVSGGGYTGCARVYFFFDGVRIGSGTPDAAGFIDVGGLSVPGDAEAGEHRVTSSCRASGGPVRGSTAFVVTEADVHRSAVATSINDPDQISLELDRLAVSALVAIAILLLFAFPFELFNSTVEENYDEIRGWFRLPARVVDAASTASRTLTFFVCSVLGAIILGFLSPDFGLDLNSAVLVAGFTVGFIVMGAGFSLPAAFLVHRRTGEWGKLNFLPGTLAVSMVLVGLSRLLDFQPGYFYGALAGIAFASALSKAVQGKVTAANWSWALVLSVAAWFANMRVSELAAEPDASAWWIGLEACLVLIFLWGIEGVAVAMLPMRFLDGRKVIDWNRVVWSVLMFLGVFAVVHVLLSPNSGYVGQTTGEVAIGVLLLFCVFGAISV